MTDNYYNIRFILLFLSHPFLPLVLQKRLISSLVVFSPPLVASSRLVKPPPVFSGTAPILYSLTLARVAHNLYYYACAPKILLFLRTRIDGKASEFAIKPSASGRVETI